MSGRSNYERMSQRLGLGTRLVDYPDDANSPEIAARILCAFFVDAAQRWPTLFSEGDPSAIHRRIVGGAPKPSRFVEPYQKLLAQLSPPRRSYVSSSSSCPGSVCWDGTALNRERTAWPHGCPVQGEPCAKQQEL
jgi:hypothetical protein